MAVEKGGAVGGLFEEPAPTRGSSAAVKAAAQAAAAEAAEQERALILRFLRSCGSTGATDDEIQRALSLSGDTERRRRRELEKRGLVRYTGEHRRTARSHWAAVWVVSEIGGTL